MKKPFPLIFLLIIYFTFLGGSLYTITNFPLKVINHVLVTLILGFWLWRKIRWGKEEPLPRTPLDWPLAFWLGVQFLSAALAWYPRFSFESLWLPITHAIAFYLLVDLIRNHGRDLIRAVYLSSAVVCLIGLFEFGSWYFGFPLLPTFRQSWAEIGGLANPIPPYWYRINFTLNGATSLSAYLALLIPPAFALWLTLKKKDDRQSLAAWLILAVVVLILTFSRGGILALGVSMPLLIVAWLSLQPPEHPLFAQFRRIPKRVGLAAIIIVVVLGLGGLFLFQQRITPHGNGDQVRLNLWESALNMAADYPITGVGPKMYGRALRTYRDPNLARDQITSAHNLYLNTAAETGALGLLAGGWLMGAFVLAAWRNWQATTSPTRRLRLAGVAAALVGFGTQSLVDNFNATQIMIPILLGVAYLLKPQTSTVAAPVSPNPGWVKRRSYFMITLVLGYALLLGLWDTAQFHFQQAARQARQNNFAGALASAEQAAQLDPALTLYRFEIAYYQSHLAQENRQYLLRAIETYQAALRLENTNADHYANLAGLLRQVGDRQEAIAAMEQARQLDSKNPLILFNLGSLYEDAGKIDQSLEFYGQTALIYSDIIDSGYLVSSLREAIISYIDQNTNDPGLMSRLHLANHDPAQAEMIARLMIEKNPTYSASYIYLVKALLAQDKPAEAVAVLTDQASRLASRGDGLFYLLRGQANWAAQNPDTEAIVRDLKTALFISPFANAQAYHTLGQIYEAEGRLEEAKQAYARAMPPLVSSQNYNVVLYGRSTTHQSQVPQLLAVGLGESQAAPWLRLLALYETEGQTEKSEQVKQSLKTLYPYLETP